MQRARLEELKTTYLTHYTGSYDWIILLIVIVQQLCNESYCTVAILLIVQQPFSNIQCPERIKLDDSSGECRRHGGRSYRGISLIRNSEDDVPRIPPVPAACH